MQQTRTIAIPGGTAEIRTKLNVGQRQAIQLAGVPAAALAVRLSALPDVADDASDEEKAELTRLRAQVEMSAAEATALMSSQNLSVFHYLASWTLADPLPASVEEVALMDADVYDAIAAEVGTAPSGVDTSVSLDGQSPFVASGSSATS